MTIEARGGGGAGAVANRAHLFQLHIPNLDASIVASGHNRTIVEPCNSGDLTLGMGLCDDREMGAFSKEISISKKAYF